MKKESNALCALGDFCALQSADSVPAQAKQVALTALIDVVGVTLAGSLTRVAKASLAVSRNEASSGVASVLSADHRASAGLPPAAAASVNATAGHALDFDDNCYAGFVHGSVVIAPAAMAVAQQLNAGGAELLHAFIVGSECQYALGSAMGRAVYDEGWWTTGVYGVLGACAAASNLLKLPGEATTSALGIALAGSGAMKSCFGTDAKPLLAGHAAAWGVRSALLAAQGCSGPGDAVEHPAGFAHLFRGDNFDMRPLAMLGHEWQLLSPGIDVKRIPVCLSSHAAVEGALQLLQTEKLDIHQIDRVVCDVPPTVVRNLRQKRPTNGQEAQFSLAFAVATALLFGDISLDMLNSEFLSNSALAALMERVEMVSTSRWNDGSLRFHASEGAHVSVQLADGRAFELLTKKARGSAEHPLSSGELARKFFQCATRATTDAGARMLLGKLQDIEQLQSTRSLLDGVTMHEGH